MALKEDLIHLLRTDPELRETARREILTEELLSLPARLERLAAAQERTEARLESLAAAQERTEARLESLAAAQERTEARLESLVGAQERTEVRVGELATLMEAIAREVHGLSDWRRGEQGRREGERYERNTVRHALAIFGGGRSATQSPEGLERLQRALDPLAAGLSDEEDPFLADILWQKGDRIAVAEVSRQVDRSDVERAQHRAETLRSAGLKALPVVIGRDWAHEEAERVARDRSVEWRVGEELSGGYLDFRRAPSGPPPGASPAGPAQQ